MLMEEWILKSEMYMGYYSIKQNEGNSVICDTMDRPRGRCDQ